MRRIERLINLIAALLDSPTPMTGDQIRARIQGYDQGSADAFRRAFERDKADLKAIGIPLEVHEPLGAGAPGYIIPKKKYYLPQLDLEPDELAALRVAAEAVLGGGEDAEMGLLKLAVGAGGPEAGGPRLAWGAEVAAEQPLLGPLYSALSDRRVVSFSYRSATSETAERREVEPYGLVLKGGKWYLVGHDRARRDLRRFRVSRIEGPVDVREARYQTPASFDAAAEVDRAAWEIGDEPVPAVVRFDASTRWWAEQNMPGAATRGGPRGSLDVELPVANFDALVSWVIDRGTGVEIVSPKDARQRLVDHLAPFLEGVP